MNVNMTVNNTTTVNMTVIMIVNNTTADMCVTTAVVKRAAARRFFIKAAFRSHSQLDEDRDVKNTEHEWEGGELYPTSLMFLHHTTLRLCIPQVT